MKAIHVLGTALCAAGLLLAQEQVTVLQGAKVMPASGPPIENGVVVIAGGKVQLVGGKDTPIPQNARVIDATGKVVTPGFVDAATLLGVDPRDQNEQSDEVTPHMRILDALNPTDKRFVRARRAGVTTLQVNPGNRNVIGGTGVVLKTHGDTIAQMLLADRSGLRVTLGGEPSRGNMAIRGGTPDSIYFRRPTTRMGVVWALRKAFYDAITYREKRTAGANANGGAATAMAENPAFEVLLLALDKKLPVRTTARAEQDIRTALRIAQEFGYETMLEDPTEAWRVLELIAQSKVKVLFGPCAQRASGEARGDGAEGRDTTLVEMAKANIPFALTTAGSGTDLAKEAMFAVRNGLSPEQALQAVTLVPAQILGIDQRVGSLAAGKDADLLVWSGDPFDPTSRLETTFINGKEIQ